ncbi:hypothetical protein [Halorubrum sp. CBA1229]|uniref:hypothetical protein n=1 Tax=Halorubrum sp. CBA1229 TaxID=1853699 RepID=UPI0011CD9A08|nr:hypothetical protein [Halorubrum sp. CBA1229]QKY18311.1 hypothetical protein Hrr1229_016005 [Halorubrum sp. CBA1229]
MSDTTDTVELPASPKIKQLAHDIVRDDREDIAPLLLDFYEFLSILDEGGAERPDLKLDEPKSQMPAAAWIELLDTMESAGIIEEDLGSRNTYALNELE